MASAETISDREFAQLSALIHELTGIQLAATKKIMVCGRLGKRLAQLGLERYGDYIRHLCSGKAPQELQVAVDLLTTNETYFFREPAHFDFLQREVVPRAGAGHTFRVWSAACSSGEEPYSIAMVLADCLGARPWEVVASDISTRVLERARTGHYVMQRTEGIPERYLKAYCLKGRGEHAGTLLVERTLRARVDFRHINLNEPLPALGEFDVVFLRNVMIYFDPETKRKVVQRIMSVMRPGGYLLIGHSESLNGVNPGLRQLMPSVYRKEAVRAAV